MARRTSAPPPKPKASSKAAPGKKPASSKPPLGRRVLKLLLKLTLLGVVLGMLTLVVGYWYFARDLPEFDGLNAWRPAETSRVVAADGTLLMELFKERRTIITRDQVPDTLVDAVTSAEDADFFNHQGLDYMGMARALFNSLRAGHLTGSGSTITQQTVKNVLLTHEKSFKRKAQEIILTGRIESALSKDQILMLYLNSIYLGHGRYGVQSASELYFGKDASKLDYNEAATLAGVIQSPENHSPLKHPGAAAKRRAYVLDMLVKNGKLSAAEAEHFKASPLPIKAAAERPEPVESQWFVTHVRRQAMALLGEEAVLTGGFTIRTTLDPVRQAAALEAVRKGVADIEERQGYNKPSARAVGAEEVARWQAARNKDLKGAPPPAGKSVPGRFIKREGEFWLVDLGIGSAKVRGVAADRLGKGHPQTGDVYPVRVRGDGPRHPEVMNATLANGPQGAFVAIDPRTRHVLALVGGVDHADSRFDRATQSRRQPGSAFKPFVWGAAFASRRYHPGSILVDAPETWQIQPGKWWQPKNYTGKFKGPMSLRDALANSINSIAIKLAHDVGVPAVQDFARRAGWQSALDPHLSLALGSSGVSPLELVNTYATLAADGVFAEPVWITDIVGPDGKSVVTQAQLHQRPPPPEVEDATPVDEDAPPLDEDAPDAPPPAPPVVLDGPGLDIAEAWLLRDVMRSVVEKGSAKSLKDFNRPLVGKTGTSNDSVDTWFVGLLPEVAMGIWFGFDTPKRLGKRESGGATAVPAAGLYLRKVEAKGKVWPPPPADLVAQNIDPTTGLLAAEGQPGVPEWFLRGTEPTRQAVPEGEVDAENFFADQVQALPDGPARLPAVPSNPDALRPATPRTMQPADLRPAAPASGAGLAPATPPDARGNGPSLAVPTIDVRPVPPGLTPVTPVRARPVGDDDDTPPDDTERDDGEDGEDADRGEGGDAPGRFDRDRFDEDRPED